MLDTFGQEVSNFTLSMPIVRDGSNANVTNYFQLFETTTTNYYNVKVTEDYWDNIYFGSDPNLINFTFKFVSVVDTVSTPFLEIGNPNNIAPTISAYQDRIDEPCGRVYYKNRNVINIVTKWGKNGAGNQELRNRELVWEITSQVNSSGDPVAANQLFTLDVGQDGFGTLIGTPDYVSEVVLQNLPDINQNQNRPVDKYTIVMQLTDPGQSTDTCTIIIEQRATSSVTEWRSLEVYAQTTEVGTQSYYNVYGIMFKVEANEFGANEGWYYKITEEVQENGSPSSAALLSDTVNSGAIGIVQNSSSSGPSSNYYSNAATPSLAAADFEALVETNNIPSSGWLGAQRTLGTQQTNFQGYEVELL